jgi:hypothetical protein
VDAEKAHYPVRMLCRLLRVSRAGFYAWRRQAPSRRVAGRGTEQLRGHDLLRTSS